MAAGAGRRRARLLVDLHVGALGEARQRRLPELPVADYWRRTRARFANPAIDHRLDQIGEDGAFKLSQRLYPLILANARAGRPTAGMLAVVQAYLRRHPPADAAALQHLFPAELWSDPDLRRALTPTPLPLQD